MLWVLEAEPGLRMDPVRLTDAAPLEEAEERPPSTESSSSMFLSGGEKHQCKYGLTSLNAEAQLLIQKSELSHHSWLVIAFNADGF